MKGRLAHIEITNEIMTNILISDLKEFPVDIIFKRTHKIGFTNRKKVFVCGRNKPDNIAIPNKFSVVLSVFLSVILVNSNCA